MFKYFKKIKLLIEINSLIKGFLIKKKLLKLQQYYFQKSISNKVEYKAETAINNFKENLKLINPKFLPKKTGKLRILWVGSNQNQDESGLLQALKKISILKEFYNKNNTYGLWYGDSNKPSKVQINEIIECNDISLKYQIDFCIENGGLDIIIGQMWSNYISTNSLEYARNKGVPVINISMDDRLPEHWSSKFNRKLGALGLTNQTDIVLTTSPETCLWYLIEGCPSIYFPLASSSEIFASNHQILRDIDVLFIGNKYGVREKIITYLIGKGLNVEAYGLGWNNGVIDAEKMASLSKRAKIILGIGTISHCSNIYTLKLRDFDAPMSGALYITHRNKDLLEFFTEGVNIEFFQDKEEVYKKIYYYLNNEQERVRIGLNGQKTVLMNHTWLYRFTSTFEKLGILESQ